MQHPGHRHDKVHRITYISNYENDCVGLENCTVDKSKHRLEMKPCF